MPPGSSQERKTLNPPAAISRACWVTVWPFLFRVSLILTPLAATLARSARVSTA